jgi:hypothetical protein
MWRYFGHVEGERHRAGAHVAALGTSDSSHAALMAPYQQVTISPKRERPKEANPAERANRTIACDGHSLPS